jgi:hypothetical protein
MSKTNPIIDAYLSMFKQPEVAAPVELQETTVPEELQHIPAKWDHHELVSDDTHEKIKKAMTHGSFTHFPLDHNGADIDPDLAEHLTTHGYQVKDFSKGIVTKKIHAGDVKREKWVDSDITSVLNKTKASPSLISDYAKTKSEQEKAAKNPALHVVISTSPLAIAGMTTGTQWKDKSCMNMEGGAFQHKLRNDSETGTHVAFLVPRDDATAFKYGEPSKPIARIALKPFHEWGTGKEHERDTIFRPERVTYGNGSNSFTNAVSQWASDKYPAKVDTEYEKNSKVYDDTGETTYKTLSAEDVEKKLKKGHDLVEVQGQSTDKHVIDHAIDYVAKNIPASQGEAFEASRAVKNIARIGNLTTEHVTKLHRILKEHLAASNNRDAYERGFSSLANSHGDKFSTKAIEEYHNDMAMGSVGQLPNKILMSPKMPDKVINELKPSQFAFVRRSLIKPHHIDKLVDSYVDGEHGSTKAITQLKDLINEDHINRIAKTMKDSHVSRTVDIFAEHPAFSKEAHDTIMHRLQNASTGFRADSSHAMAADELMAKSRHATIDDAHKLPTINAIGSLMHNESIPDSEHVKIKNEIVKRVVASPEAHVISLRQVPGFISTHTIPNLVSKHFTDKDYRTLAEKRFISGFENKVHSNKYLDHQFDRAKHFDDEISAHIESKEHENPSYDSDLDDHVQNLKEQLDKHVSAFSHSLTAHINKHIEPSEDGGYPKDYEELQRTQKRITNPDMSSDRSIENLQHYNNKSDHFYDHFQDDIDVLHHLRNVSNRFGEQG